MAMMTPLEWQQWAQGARAGQQGALSRLLPALQFQNAQRAYQQGGTQGLLQAGFFPQAQAAARVGAVQSADAQRARLGQLVSGLGGQDNVSILNQIAMIDPAMAKQLASNMAGPTRRTAKDSAGVERYMDTGQPVLSQEGAWRLAPSERGSLVKARRDEFGPIQSTFGWADTYRQMRADTPGRAGDFTRLQTLGKLLDPGSVVREGEAALMTMMGASNLQEAVRRLEGLFTAQGFLTPEARVVVDRAIETAIRANATSASRIIDSWDAYDESNELGEVERRRVNPFPGARETIKGLLDLPGTEPESYTEQPAFSVDPALRALTDEELDAREAALEGGQSRE